MTWLIRLATPRTYYYQMICSTKKVSMQNYNLYQAYYRILGQVGLDLVSPYMAYVPNANTLLIWKEGVKRAYDSPEN